MIGEYVGLKINKISSELFERAKTLHSSNEPTLIIFDEVQAVADNSKEYQTRLTNFMNNLLKSNENLYILLTGSQVRTFNEYMEVFQDSTIYNIKTSSAVVNLPQLSKAELEEFLERGFSHNGLQIPTEDYIDLVYETLGGFIGYVSEAARNTIQVLEKNGSETDMERKVLNERGKLFEEMKKELRDLGKSLGFVTRGPMTTPSVYILRRIARNPNTTLDEITSTTLEKFQTIDEEYVKIVLEILEQVDLVHKHNEKYFTHKFIENYRGGDMVEFFEWQTYQLKKHVEWGEKFIIFRGSRFSGKTYFAREAFEELGVLYFYVDVAGIRKIKTKNTSIFETMKADYNGLRKYTKTNIEDFRLMNLRTFREFFDYLEEQEKDVYVVFDHAEAFYPWSYFGTFFRTIIDNYSHPKIVLVPASTPALIEKSGVNNPDKPLFARWEKYVDFEYWSAGDVLRYFDKKLHFIDENIWHLFDLTEGAPQLVMKYVELRRKYPSNVTLEKLKGYVKEKVLEEVSGSEWVMRIMKAIASDTDHRNYTRLKNITQILDEYKWQTVKTRFFDQVLQTGYIEQMGNNIRIRPFIVNEIFNEFDRKQ